MEGMDEALVSRPSIVIKGIEVRCPRKKRRLGGRGGWHGITVITAAAAGSTTARR